MAMDEVGLGKSLQRARQAAGMTQQELCQKAGLSYSTLAKIERGAIKSPSIFTIQKIGEALQVDLNHLLGISPIYGLSKPKIRSKSGIRFVYFDVNGCLVRFFHKAFTKIAADTGVRVEAVESAFWHYNDAVCRGEMTNEEFNQKLSEKLNTPRIDWQEYYLSSVEPVEGMDELLKWAAENYYVGLLTNIMPGQINELKKRGLIPNIAYKAIVDSSEIGSLKPEKQVYEVALSRSGVEPNEILLVDDSRSNLMAADKLGWKVLWFDDYEPSESITKIHSSLEPEELTVQSQQIVEPVSANLG